MPKARSKNKASHLDFAALKAHCLAKAGTAETYPFGPEVAVFKVIDKMFALCRPDQSPLKINLKCEPRLAELLREAYQAVEPGWHMNKRHWNTVTTGLDLNDELIFDQIDRSYDLVYASLPKKVRQSLIFEQ